MSGAILSQSRALRRALERYNELPEIWQKREGNYALHEEAQEWRDLKAAIECQGFSLRRIYIDEQDEGAGEGKDVWVLMIGPPVRPAQASSREG